MGVAPTSGHTAAGPVWRAVDVLPLAVQRGVQAPAPICVGADPLVDNRPLGVKPRLIGEAAVAGRPL
jgi:hypothetical protein